MKIVVLTFLLLGCSSGKKVEGVNFNKLRPGVSSYLSITQSWGKPQEEAQVPNEGPFHFSQCGKNTDYLIAAQYDLGSSTRNDSDVVTLFFDKRKVLCHYETKDFDL